MSKNTVVIIIAIIIALGVGYTIGVPTTESYIEPSGYEEIQVCPGDTIVEYNDSILTTPRRNYAIIYSGVDIGYGSVIYIFTVVERVNSYSSYSFPIHIAGGNRYVGFKYKNTHIWVSGGPRTPLTIRYMEEEE